MDDLQFDGSLNSISVISSRWNGDNERLFAMEPCLWLESFPPLRRLKQILLSQQVSTLPAELVELLLTFILKCQSYVLQSLTKFSTDQLKISLTCAQSVPAHVYCITMKTLLEELTS